MTEEQATMLVCSFYVTCNFGCVVYSEMTSHGFAGANSGTSITLGGVKPDGTTAVNALTYVFLHAEELVNLSSEDIVIRINDNSPAEYLTAAVRLARALGGKLKFVGDATTIANLE